MNNLSLKGRSGFTIIVHLLLIIVTMGVIVTVTMAGIYYKNRAVKEEPTEIVDRSDQLEDKLTDIYAFDFENEEERNKFWAEVNNFIFSKKFQVVIRQIESSKPVDKSFD